MQDQNTQQPTNIPSVSMSSADVMKLAQQQPEDSSQNIPQVNVNSTDVQNGNVDQNAATDTNSIGWFHQAVQDIAKPFLEVPTTIAAGGATALAGMFGGKDAAQKVRDYATQNGLDFGYLGKVKPVGSDAYLAAQRGEINTPTEVARMGAGLASTGAQIASWFVGGPEAKATEGAVEGGLQAVKAGFFNGVLNFVKHAIPFSALQAAGTGLSDVEQGKGAGQTALDTSLNFAGNIAGYAIFKGATNLLQYAGAKMIQNPTILAANQFLVDKMAQVFGTSVEDMTPTVMKEVTQGVENAHKSLIQGISDSIKTNTALPDLWKTVTSEAEPYIQNLFNAPDSIFKDFYQKAPPIEDFKNTMDLIQNKASEYLDSIYGKTADKSITPEAFKSGNFDVTGARGDSPLQQYIDQITTSIGTDGSTPITAKTVESLYNKGALYTGKTSVETSLINQLGATLKKDMVSFLNSSDATKPLVDLYRQGQSASEFNKDFLQHGIMDHINTIGTNAKNFLDTQVLSKAPNLTEAETLLKSLGGVGSKAQQQFSELIFNRVLETAQKVSTDTTKGGDFIKNFLEKWTNTGLLTMDHVNMLDNFADFMKNKSGDYLDAIQKMMGEKTAQFEPAAQKLETKTSQLQSLQTFTKSVGDKPLFKANGDGTFDVTNLLNGLKAANTDEKTFNGLIESFSKINPEKVSQSKLQSIIKTGLGVTLTSLGHPWWGVTMTAKGVKGIVSGEGKVGAKDVVKMVSSLVGQVDSKGQPYITPSLLTDLLSDKIDIVTKAVSVLQKATQGITGKGTSDIPSKLTPDISFDQYQAATQSMMGSTPLTSEQVKQLQDQYNSNQ